MSLFFSLPKEFEDLERYQIGAFFKDKDTGQEVCCGLAEKVDFPNGGSCLYMRIRNNDSDGVEIKFKLLDLWTNETSEIKKKDGSPDGPPFEFVANEMVGAPSSPYDELTPYFSVNINVGNTIYGRVSMTTESENINSQTSITRSLPYGIKIILSASSLDASRIKFFNWSDGSFNSTYEFTLINNVSLKALYASATSQPVKIIFNIDGDIIETFQGPYLDVSIPNIPVKEGYRFEWNNPSPVGQKVSSSTTYSGKYIINSYTATFKIDDKTIATQTVEYGKPITAPEGQGKEGYTLVWQNIPETMPGYNIDIEGTYNVNSYTATFKIDGETIDTQTVEYGKPITAPNPPVKLGYTFDGWKNMPPTMPPHDIELEGSYSINTYQAVFKIDGEVYKTLSFEYDAEIRAPEVPEKPGYNFTGWQNMPVRMPAHDIEIEGSYRDVPLYTVEFRVDGEFFADQKLAAGEPITVPEPPVKPGYTFSGWGEVPATMPAENIVINGSFSVNTYDAVFKIDGEVYKTLPFEYGAAVEAPAVEEKEGYTFSGWSEIPETMPDHNIEVNGSYTVNTYDAVFILDGEVYKTLPFEYGAPVEAPAVEEKEGYTFDGWKDVPETMPAHDIEIQGSYSANVYRAVFKIGEEVITEKEIAYGAKIEVPEAPAKEGYTFGGWKDVPETMPAHDIEIQGSYSANVYKAVFM
ncbi:MAG: InlB B-repeat-containing protein, partial [Muribaculaceae bacterium]|nr:InlB B-repeat-containing protein [Muribaculaceae bacterium]